jgi:tetratricopeptide (TPR) repeat protein
MNPRYEAIIEQYQKTRDLQKFAEGLEQMERRGEGFFLIYLQLGIAYNGLSRPRDAAAAFAQAVAIDPEHYLAQYELGCALKKLKRDEEAIHAFYAAARIDPKRSEPLANAAGSYLRLQKYEEAAAACRESLARNPSDNVALRNLEVLRSLLAMPPQKRAGVTIEFVEPPRSAGHGAP